MHSFKKLGKWPTRADRLGCQQTRMNPKKNGSKSTPLESFTGMQKITTASTSKIDQARQHTKPPVRGSHRVPIVQTNSTKPSAVFAGLGLTFLWAHGMLLAVSCGRVDPSYKPSQNVPCPGRGRNRALVTLRRELQSLPCASFLGAGRVVAGWPGKVSETFRRWLAPIWPPGPELLLNTSRGCVVAPVRGWAAKRPAAGARRGAPSRGGSGIRNWGAAWCFRAMGV